MLIASSCVYISISRGVDLGWWKGAEGRWKDQARVNLSLWRGVALSNRGWWEGRWKYQAIVNLSCYMGRGGSRLVGGG